MFLLLFGRMRLKTHSEKTEDARPKREQRKREGASSGTRKSAALSRLVSKRLLARLARARNVGQIVDEEGEVFAEGIIFQKINFQKLEKIESNIRVRRKSVLQLGVR